MTITSVKLYPPEGYGSPIELTTGGRYLGDFIEWLGHPAVQYDTVQLVGRDGVKVLGGRMTERIVDVPLIVVASRLDDLLAKLDAIYAVAGYRGADRFCRLVVNDTYELRVLYLGETHRPIAGMSYEVTLRFLAPDPYWYNVTSQTQTFDVTNTPITERRVIMRSRHNNAPLWKALTGTADPPFPYEIRTLVFDEYGNLYAGGNFYTMGGVSANHLAMWNGTTWTEFGGGANGAVEVLKFAPNGDLYAGGRFTQIGGVSANYIARWNGSTWVPLGSGTSTYVTDIAFDPYGNVYVTGYFETAGGVTVNYVAKWDGSNWHALGSGLNGIGRSILYAPNGNLYVAGEFTTAGGVTVNYIARWDGSNWYALGSGLNNHGLSLYFDDTTGLLYVGGYFSTAGGVNARLIAVWDGARWSPLPGNPFSPSINLGSVLKITKIDGQIWVGGFHKTSTDTMYYPVHIWDGNRMIRPDFEPTSGTSTNAIASYKPAGQIGISDIAVQIGAINYISTKNLTITGLSADSAEAKPIFKITGPCKLRSICRLSTAQYIRFDDLQLAPGEILTIDTEKLTVTTNTGRNLIGAMLPGSQFTEMGVGGVPGEMFNVFTIGEGSATVEYKPRYRTLSEAIG